MTVTKLEKERLTRMISAEVSEVTLRQKVE